MAELAGFARGNGPNANAGWQAPRTNSLPPGIRRARKRWQGTTTQRGYGHGHQAERERRLAMYRPGDPCAHCGQPIAWWPPEVARDLIDLPHNASRTGYLPGLAHRACNRADGARRGNRTRSRARAWQAARIW